MAQEADLKSVGLIAYGFESRLRYHLVKNERGFILMEEGSTFKTTAYEILGYDKDAGVYICLAHWYGDINSANQVANYIGTLSLGKETGKPFDWIEVIEEYSGDRRHICLCS